MSTNQINNTIMAEKKTTKTTAAKATTPKAPKTTVKKAPAKAICKNTIDLDAAGTNAGKVWVALNTAKKPLTLAEISKNTGLCETCTAIALGWLAREAKVKGVDKFELYAYE